MPVPQQLVERTADCQENWEYIQSRVFEPGDIKQSVRTADHSGWLLCDGRAITGGTLRTILLQAGSPFGVSGSDPKIPDARERVMVGAGATHTLGTAFGSAAANMPSHSHGGQTGSMNRSNPHFHYITGYPNTTGASLAVTNMADAAANAAVTQYTDINHEHSITLEGSGSATDGNYPLAVTVNFFIHT